MKKIFNFCKKNENTLGIIGTVLSIIMFFSLIEVFISNIQGKSNIIIQPIATAIAALIWCLYAYGKKDKYVLTVNVFAFFLGSLTILSVFI